MDGWIGEGKEGVEWVEGGRGSDTMTWPGSGSSGQKGRRSIGKVEVRVVVGRRRGERGRSYVFKMFMFTQIDTLYLSHLNIVLYRITIEVHSYEALFIVIRCQRTRTQNIV